MTKEKYVLKKCGDEVHLHSSYGIQDLHEISGLEWHFIFQNCATKYERARAITFAKQCKEGLLYLIKSNAKYLKESNTLSEFDDDDWAYVASSGKVKFEKFLTYCKNFETFGYHAWHEILKAYPQALKLAEKYQQGWIAILLKNPEREKKCPFWGDFNEKDFEYICIEGGFYHRFKKWDSIPPLRWVNYLREKPELADKCNCWNEFTKQTWIYFLLTQPILFARCPIIDAFNRKDWAFLKSKIKLFEVKNIKIKGIYEAYTK